MIDSSCFVRSIQPRREVLVIQQVAQLDYDGIFNGHVAVCHPNMVSVRLSQWNEFCPEQKLSQDDVISCGIYICAIKKFNIGNHFIIFEWGFNLQQMQICKCNRLKDVT